MRQILDEVWLYFNAITLLLLFNLCWAAACSELFLLYVRKKYRSVAVGTALERGDRVGNLLLVVGLPGLPIITILNLLLISNSVAISLQSAIPASLIVATLAGIYVLVPLVLKARLRVIVEGMDDSVWEDAFMAPARTASMVLGVRLIQREVYALLAVIAFVQAFAVRFPSAIHAGNRVGAAAYEGWWRPGSVIGCMLLVYALGRTSLRVYLYLFPEMLVAYRAVTVVGRVRAERRGTKKWLSVAARRNNGLVAVDREYQLFAPPEWRGERHWEIVSLARSIIRAPRRFRRRFTRSQVETIERAARALCSTLLSGAVNAAAQREVVTLSLPYATSLMFHRDPVFVAEQILRKFEVDHPDVKIGGRGLVGAIGAFNEIVKITGPLLRLMALVLVAAILISLGKPLEVLDFVKKLLGG